MKACPKCKLVLPRSAFYKDPSKKGGLSSYCKKCAVKKSEERRKPLSEMPEEEADRYREYYRKHERKERLADLNRPLPRHGYQWTGPEIELLDREDLTSIQIARMIGRTIKAVREARRRRHDGIWTNSVDKITEP